MVKKQVIVRKRFACKKFKVILQQGLWHKNFKNWTQLCYKLLHYTHKILKRLDDFEFLYYCTWYTVFLRLDNRNYDFRIGSVRAFIFRRKISNTNISWPPKKAKITLFGYGTYTSNTSHGGNLNIKDYPPWKFIHYRLAMMESILFKTIFRTFGLRSRGTVSQPSICHWTR